MTTLVDALVPDDLWAILQPLLPPPPRPWWGGRRRTIPDRNCFAAIVFMTRTSTPWRLLPAQELGCGSLATVWRRLNQWASAGVFEQLHLEILDRLGMAGRLDWSRASLDSMSVRAKHGGPRWRKSGRSRQAWVQAPPGLRGARAAADRGGHRRQYRWRVERVLSWLSCWRRLQVRWDRSSERWFAFVLLACALTCFKRL
jgi:transposase